MKIRPLILVVDNDPKNIKALGTFLVPEGYDVFVSHDTASAVKRVHEADIDLVIIDLTMSGESAFDATRRLKDSPTTRHIPVILTVQSHEAGHREKGIQAGCDDIICKPFDENDVRTRVGMLLKISSARPLLNEKEKFDYILNHINDGIVVLDTKLSITHINEPAKNLLEFDVKNRDSDIIGHIARNFTIQYDADLARDILKQPLAFDIERRATRSTKSRIIGLRTSVVRNPLGEISNIVIILNDVTEVRHKEYLQQNFLDLISHKLRTPLAVILGNASLLTERAAGQLNKKQADLVRGIIEKEAVMGQLIDKLLVFTAIDKTIQGVPQSTFKVSERLKEMVLALSKISGSRKNAIRVDCPDDTAISMNRTHFELIIANLIENAIKFHDKKKLEIHVETRKKANGISVSVSDNGPGIPAEEKEKIFERFYQIEKDFTGNIEGAGLGLALVRHLVTAYGGSVTVESKIKEGSTFTVTLKGVVA